MSESRRKLAETYEQARESAEGFHLSTKWVPIIGLTFLFTLMALALAVASYVVDTTDVTNIYDDIPGVYPAVQAATNSPLLGKLSLDLAIPGGVELLVDGVSIQPGDRLLVKNELNPQMNGIYVRTDTALVRAPDMARSSQVSAGVAVFVLKGTTNGGASFTVFKAPNNGGGLDSVTGYGVMYMNTTALLTGAVEQKPAEGSIPTLDPAQPTTIRWVDPGAVGSVKQVDTNNGLTGGPITSTGTIGLAPMAAGTLKGNATTASAVPQDIPMVGEGTLLTVDSAGALITVPAGAPGHVLTYVGGPAVFSWNATAGVGTVTSVGVGVNGGLVASPSPITGAGTISIISIPANSLLVNNTAAPASPYQSVQMSSAGQVLSVHVVAGVTTIAPTVAPGSAGLVLSSPAVPATDLPVWASLNLTAGAGDTNFSFANTNPLLTTATGTISLVSQTAWSVKGNASATFPNGTTDVALAAVGDILTNTGTGLVYSAGAINTVLTSGGPGMPVSWSAIANPTQVYRLWEQQALNSKPADTPSENAWTPRTLTNSSDGVNVPVVGANFTLQPGTWMIHVTAPAFRVGNHIISLMTGATLVAMGTSSFSGPTAQDVSYSILDWPMVVAAPTTYFVQHWVNYVDLVVAQSSFGIPMGAAVDPGLVGYTNTYTTIQLIKIA